MKLVSVLLPCYNSERYIGEAIQSILDQTYTNFELLILDDGSTDNTKSIITGFLDNRITLLFENENKGIVYQLNKGIEHAKGEFIARMDADDVSFPERFQKQIDFLNDIKNKQIDILGTDATSIGIETKDIQHRNYKPKQISFLLNFYCPILHPTIMMRKRLFINGLKYPSEYKYAEDLALWRLVDNGKNMAILNESLLYYRIHVNQTNGNEKRKGIQKNSTLNALTIPRRSCNLYSLVVPNGIGKSLWEDLEYKSRNTSIMSKLVLRFQYSILRCNSSMALMLMKG
jgi:glycosyltransferase involved in cell wall biosynthesis